VDFDRLFRDVFPSLHRYCARMTGDADAAEDVAQEAFVRMVTRDVSGEPPELRVWLFRVAKNLVRDRHRIRENRSRLLEANPVEPSEAPPTDRRAERSETIAAVRAALDALSERDRTLLLMREEGFAYQEIADVVEVKTTSVGSLLARALARFEEAYAAQHANDDPAEAGKGTDDASE